MGEVCLVRSGYIDGTNDVRITGGMGWFSPVVMVTYDHCNTPICSTSRRDRGDG